MNIDSIVDDEKDRLKFEANLAKAYNKERRIELCRKYLQYHNYIVSKPFEIEETGYARMDQQYYDGRKIIPVHSQVMIDDYAKSQWIDKNSSFEAIRIDLARSLLSHIMKSNLIKFTEHYSLQSAQTIYGAKVDVIEPKNQL